MNNFQKIIKEAQRQREKIEDRSTAARKEMSSLGHRCLWILVIGNKNIRRR